MLRFFFVGTSLQRGGSKLIEENKFLYKVSLERVAYQRMKANIWQTKIRELDKFYRMNSFLSLTNRVIEKLEGTYVHLLTFLESKKLEYFF